MTAVTSAIKLINSSLKSEFRFLCSVNNELIEFIVGDYLPRHVKNVIITNKLKRNENYYQSKYSNNEYSKDYAKSN